MLTCGVIVLAVRKVCLLRSAHCLLWLHPCSKLANLGGASMLPANAWLAVHVAPALCQCHLQPRLRSSMHCCYAAQSLQCAVSGSLHVGSCQALHAQAAASEYLHPCRLQAMS